MSEDIDLINDPEGQQIAKGLLQYVKSLAGSISSLLMVRLFPWRIKARMR
jgi:hypothetical protein